MGLLRPLTLPYQHVTHVENQYLMLSRIRGERSYSNVTGGKLKAVLVTRVHQMQTVCAHCYSWREVEMESPYSGFDKR